MNAKVEIYKDIRTLGSIFKISDFKISAKISEVLYEIRVVSNPSILTQVNSLLHGENLGGGGGGGGAVWRKGERKRTTTLY